MRMKPFWIIRRLTCEFSHFFYCKNVLYRFSLPNSPDSQRKATDEYRGGRRRKDCYHCGEWRFWVVNSDEYLTFPSYFFQIRMTLWTMWAPWRRPRICSSSGEPIKSTSWPPMEYSPRTHRSWSRTRKSMKYGACYLAFSASIWLTDKTENWPTFSLRNNQLRSISH